MANEFFGSFAVVRQVAPGPENWTWAELDAEGWPVMYSKQSVAGTARSRLKGNGPDSYEVAETDDMDGFRRIPQVRK